MTRPIKKARVTRRRKYYGGGKKKGGTTLKKVGGIPYDVLSGPPKGPNEYATWTAALRSLIHDLNYDNLFIAKNTEGDKITLGQWKEIIQAHAIPKGPDIEKIKKYDLGGGDQTKIKELIEEKKSNQSFNVALKMEGIEKQEFLYQEGTLITGGTEKNRLKNLDEFINKGFLNRKSYALIPGMETKLTAISYYDKACELLNNPGFKSDNPQLKTLCLITVGSTDAHIITYIKKGEKVSVEHETYCEFATEDAIPIQLEQCDKYIFAGSGPFYIDTPNGWADRLKKYQKKLEEWEALDDAHPKKLKKPKKDDWTHILKAPNEDTSRDVFEKSNFESKKDYWEHGVYVNNNNEKVKNFKTLLEKIKPDDIIFRDYENADRYKTNDIIKIPTIFDFFVKPK